jgi:solute carrier family 25 phosphate transporter 23/24/25/41
MQVQNPHSIKYNGTIQGLKYIWRTEGLRGLFKGNGTNCARIVPNSAVKFFSYEQASKYVPFFAYFKLSCSGANYVLFAIFRLITILS